VDERRKAMTGAQEQRLKKLERMYGSRADAVREVMLVAFSPYSPGGVVFAVDLKGNICRAQEVADRVESLS
jgi:hypothetical protein